MNETDDLVYIKHVMDAIDAIEEYTKKMRQEDFLKDRKTQDAVIRELSVIGEATALISGPFKMKHKDMPWAEMIGTQNEAIHGYFSIDLNTIWEIVVNDLPKLRRRLRSLVK